MENLFEIFNNREIAIGLWVIIAITIGLFTKPGKQFIKEIIPILFSRRFIVFYIIFISYFIFIINFLDFIGFWTIDLLKDTIFWILFVEFPLFMKTIEKAKNNHFFINLIKENIALIIIIEFVLNFWTFSLFTEIIIVPISLIIGAIYALALKDKQYQLIKHFLDGLFVVFGFFVIINTIIHIIANPIELFNILSLKVYILPIILLLFNLPVIYGLAIYNAYEQVFIRVKGNSSEKYKIMWSIICFAGLNLSKITEVQNNHSHVTAISLTNKAIKDNLKSLENRLSMKIGYSYLKDLRFYIWCCISGILACIVFIISFKFILPIPYINKIFLYTFVILLTTLCLFLLYFVFLIRKKNMEILKIKKDTLCNFLNLLKKQHKSMQTYLPIDEPKTLFEQYIIIASELNYICDKNIKAFKNYLSTWELNMIKQLQNSILLFFYDIGINEIEINNYNSDSFLTFYTKKKLSAQQNSKLNIYTYSVESAIINYSKQIENCLEEFKQYL